MTNTREFMTGWFSEGDSYSGPCDTKLGLSVCWKAGGGGRSLERTRLRRIP